MGRPKLAETTRLSIRLEPHIYDKLCIISALEGRSRNAQMAWFIRESIKNYELQHGKLNAEETE